MTLTTFNRYLTSIRLKSLECEPKTPHEALRIACNVISVTQLDFHLKNNNYLPLKSLCGHT